MSAPLCVWSEKRIPKANLCGRQISQEQSKEAKHGKARSLGRKYYPKG